MNRQIKFNAIYEYFFDCDDDKYLVFDTESIKVVIENVIIYEDGMIGCSLKNFEKSARKYIQNTEIANDIIENIKGEPENADCDFWLYFDGQPLQYIGIKDKNGKKIFEGMTISWGNMYVYAKPQQFKIVFNCCAFGVEIKNEFKPFTNFILVKNELGWCLDIEILGYNLK